MTPSWIGFGVEASYFAAALLFILGIKRMASPVTARSGIQWAGAGMLLATAATFLYRGEDGMAIHNLGLIALALVLGTAAAWVSGKRVAITDMPQMVALYNGMGGGSAAAIGAVELLRFSSEGKAPSQAALVLGVVGALIGSISLTGSIIAWAKLDGRMDKRYTFPGQQAFNALVFVAAIGFGIAAVLTLSQPFILAFFACALLVGILMTLPIGGNPLNLKWNFVCRGRLSPYLELSGGTLFTSSKVPARTSSVNFTSGAALGTHFLGSKTWAVEARYLHISNAGLGDLNPGINTFEIRLGIGRFRKR